MAVSLYTPRKNRSSHWTGDWVGLGVGLDVVAKILARFEVLFLDDRQWRQ
jgi:hypothetical protein